LGERGRGETSVISSKVTLPTLSPTMTVHSILDEEEEAVGVGLLPLRVDEDADAAPIEAAMAPAEAAAVPLSAGGEDSELFQRTHSSAVMTMPESSSISRPNASFSGEWRSS
jgi:hypothetical protein